MSVEVNKELNELTVKRRSVKGRITKFSKYLNSLPAGDLSVQDRSQLCTKLEKFTVMFDSFDDLQSRIEVYNEDNLDDELQEREEIEDSFHSNIAFAKVKLGTISLAETSGQAERESATYTPNDSQCAHSCGGQQDLGFRLPVIQISNFDANPVNFEQVNRSLHCFVCKGKHRIYDCPAFLSMSIEERIQKASSLKLCLNCLRSGHIAGACRLSSCRICNARHNTMLHKPHTQTITATPSIDNVIPTSTTSTSTPNSVTSDTSTSSISMSVTSTSQVVLSTALVDIVNPDNNQVETVKVLLDCGSMSSFITSDLKQRLQLDTQVLDATTIVGIGNSSLNFAPERGTVTVKSRCNPFSVTLSCLVLPEITATLPRRPINMKQFSFPSNISLADPSFNVPSKVDMLIGADLFWDLIGPRQQSLGANLPTLRESKLGWFLAGHIRDKQTSNLQVDNSNTSIQCNFSALESLHTKLSRFWELEELPTSQKASEAGVDAGNPCETHFMTHTTRLENVELHAFSDASQAAYGACIYVKSIDQAGNTSILLYCAKARVAPSKAALTIPRLELCGALLAARLLCAVKSALRRQISKSYLWTDSSVVLGWIATEPSRLKVWVSNRVRQVQEMTSTSSWRYVPTAHNPADLASRGVDPHQVQDSTLWWQGPSFLSRPESEWPTLYSHKCDNLPELKVHTTLVTDSIKASIDISRYSKLQFLQRVIAYIYRFIHNCKNPHDKHTGSLTVDELEGAFTCLVRMSQQDSFPHELQTLQRQDNLKLKSSIVSLNPFLDSQGLLRVGGRLCNSQYEYEKKHPVLLHAKHHLTKLLFTQEHHRLLHAGPQLLLASIRERIWPLGGRELARRTARSCIKCRRISAQPLHNIMGNLPAQRITPDYPFSTVAVDFAGPFMITDRKGRGCKITKAYLCLFICFRSKCVHLEAVSELSRDAFMLTLRRFIARRGKPNDIFCDNGRNFVATARELGTFLSNNSDLIAHDASTHNINFHFSPAYAPNFNGLAEAGIKSAKFHLKRILGNSHLTFEEMSTLFAQVESILNSRPLCPLSSSPNDYTPLTPGHFLIGRPLMSLLSPSLEDENASRLNRYQRIEQAREHFWRRWQSEYISELQQRLKWRIRCRDLRPGDLVLIKEDNTSPLQWRLGRVQQLFPGADGIPRVADVATARGIVRRALSKICLLKADASNGGDDVSAVR
ncbi:uncharacterized protein LOC126373761 isoform X2 [Pectinophora gossypiella]|uniref:uncharacterized protein LOC126373761 isoform X2 n=1 Tax=Pectinophora gossypiella TaxID=13191 RepID=UPI00214EC1C3|nr:uncharacterized protein LOC126373761 isoform X2 [Pectinophora gossypiella]